MLITGCILPLPTSQAFFYAPLCFFFLGFLAYIIFPCYRTVALFLFGTVSSAGFCQISNTKKGGHKVELFHGYFLGERKPFAMIITEMTVGVSCSMGLASKMSEFFTWKGIREIPTPSGLSRNRQVEELGFTSGQCPSSATPSP